MAMNKNYLKWIVVTVVLGAVGSGAWEYILKPIALSGTSLILDVATLGMTKFKDGLYVDIAQGLHEQPSLSLIAFLLGVLPGILGGVLSVAITRKPSTDAERVQGKRRALTILMLFFVFIFAFSLIYTSRISYVNRAVTHFNQLMSIAGPYITQEDRLKYSSQFSQIANREDYQRIIVTLHIACEKNRANVPEFSVW